MRKIKDIWIKRTSLNGRFGKIAALAPQTILCVIERLSPAGTLVKPLPRQAAWTLAASGRTDKWALTQN